MKKIVTLLLVAVMALSCMTGMVFAAEAGEEVTVEFSTVGNPGFAGFKAHISYDADALELVKIEAGALCAGGSFVGNAAAGIVTYGSTSNSTGNGVLFTATFKVKADAAPGTYNVTAALDSDPDETFNAALENVTFIITGDSIVVEAAECEHEWGEWEVVTPATCEDAGEEKRECAVCGEVESRVVAATGHDHDEAWLYDEDNHWHECACGDVADKAAHDVKWVTTKNPTHNEAGLKHPECTVCDWVGADVEIPADPSLDDVPGTGDNTPMIVAAFVAVLGMAAVAVYVFKRKLAI